MKLKHMNYIVGIAVCLIGLSSHVDAGTEQSTLRYDSLAQEEKVVGAKELTEEEKAQLNDRLIDAAKNGRANEIAGLIAMGANVNHASNEGLTALIHAAYNGHTDNVNALLEHGADVNCASNNGNTALIHAAYNRHTDNVNALLEHGANVNHASNNGNTALIHAARKEYTKLTKELLLYGAEVNHRNADGKTALAYANRNKDQATIEVITEFKRGNIQPYSFSTAKSARK